MIFNRHTPVPSWQVLYVRNHLEISAIMGNAASSDANASLLGTDGSTPRLYELANKISLQQWPIIYTPEYNISFLGFEKLHPFDSAKWGKIIQFLIGE